MKEILTPETVSGLLDWYDANRRDLPWRHTSDPYRVWISEIMLQQTRVEAVKPYYERFLAVCPDVLSLAGIEEEKLMKLWEGLGYYSRARNLQKAARTVADDYGGAMPRTYEELRSLCGIGDYTAGAIASIAYGQRVPAVDGNVLRVLARLGASYADVSKQETKDAFRASLVPLVPERAGDFNQAMIEIGATVCVPNGEPKCGICPLAPVCRARRDGLTDELPVRSAKKPRRVEERTVLVIRDGDRTALHKRPATGLLAGLFELPNLDRHVPREEMAEVIRSFGFEPLRITPLENAKHVFTHIEWHMIAYDVKIAPEFDGYHEASGMLLVRNEDLHAHYAIPSAFSAYTKYL